METVIITGSARGLGFELAKAFRRQNLNVVISDINNNDLKTSKDKLLEISSDANVEYIVCDITNNDDIKNLISFGKEKFGRIDFWINNAGVNQPDKYIWDFTQDEMNRMIDIDLKGTMNATSLIMQEMIKQNRGAIYTVEGHGSNDAIIPKLSVYGTTKRALTYFVSSLAKESEVANTGILIGKLSPGIMITDFVVNSFRNQLIPLDDKTKKVYNILGDYPDVVAKFFVKKILSNTKNDCRIKWLTNAKASYRFMAAGFNKRNFFKKQ